MTGPAMSFTDLIGHGRAVGLLKAMLLRNRLPHAVLITGPSGVGKRTLALALAQAANCAAEVQERPCGVCGPCGKIARGVHPDVSRIEPEGRLRVTKIDSIRDLRRQIAYKPYEGRTKVYIVEEAERMQVQGDSAANALLKTLEEPPPSSLLILTALREADLLPTIVSRCLRLNLAPLPISTVEEWLAEKKGLTGPQARLAASMSEGCLGRVVDLDLDELWSVRDSVCQRLASLRSNETGPAVEWAAEMASSQDSWPRMLSLLRFWYRDLMVLAAGVPDEHLVNRDRLSTLEQWAAGRDPETFIGALMEIDRAEEALNRLIRPDLVFENLVLALADRN